MSYILRITIIFSFNWFCHIILSLGLESTHHVLEVSNNLYTAVLGMVDVTRGTNSYYKLQVLESDSGVNYRVFRSWGRVGTVIGGSKTEVIVP